MAILRFYHYITAALGWVFDFALWVRVKNGRADKQRQGEYQGRSDKPRPDAPVIWLHAASVGESQSALRIVDDILQRYTNAYVLVTTGTITSSNLMAKKLPKRAFHHFYPLDKPLWVTQFLDHWQPDVAIFMESEIWPNMFSALDQRSVPVVMMNARMSQRSANRWRKVRRSAMRLLAPVKLILAQTQSDVDAYKLLSAATVTMTGNLKYAAEPLSFDHSDFKDISDAISSRRVWVYASTHAGEEDLACQVHLYLKASFPDLLTIIVPRHPERRDDIVDLCHDRGLNAILRGDDKALPSAQNDVYIADTLGELGLFYALSDVAVIGRSFSDDGGGGHNPIEAAQLGAAVLSGAYVQYQQEIFDEMTAAQAAILVEEKGDLAPLLQHVMTDLDALQDLKKCAQAFVQSKANIISTVHQALWPVLDNALHAQQKDTKR